MEKPQSKTGGNMDDLVHRISKEAGLELYVHACNRPDLSDLPNEHGSPDDYTRAVRNRKCITPDNYANYAIGFEFLLPWNNGMNLTQHNMEKNYNIVCHGQKKVFPAPAKGWLSKMIKKLAGKSRNSPKSIPLCDFVQTQNSEDLYAVQMSFNSDVRDSANRRTKPLLTLLTGKTLTEEIVDYIRKNPQHYDDFIKAILPPEEFPNSNKGVLSLMKPTKDIILIDAEKARPNLQTEIYMPYGMSCENITLLFAGELIRTQ